MVDGVAVVETPWLKSAEAAAYVRLSVRTLEGYRRNGGGPRYYRRGGRVVHYNRDDLDEWCREGMASNTTEEALRKRD